MEITGHYKLRLDSLPKLEKFQFNEYNQYKGEK